MLRCRLKYFLSNASLHIGEGRGSALCLEMEKEAAEEDFFEEVSNFAVHPTVLANILACEVTCCFEEGNQKVHCAYQLGSQNYPCLSIFQSRHLMEETGVVVFSPHQLCSW